VVVEGPLQGLEGTVVKIARRRVVISITRGQKAVLVELDQSWVTKAAMPVQSSPSLDAE
jgi:ribosomal protein L24